MDNSLIPRAFGPTDAKREREANARLAERQSSARNMSTSSIPAGGSLGLGGDVDVEPGGNINLADGGGINIAEGGRIQLAGRAASRYALNNPGQPVLPYDTTTVLGTQTYVDTDGRTYVAPGVYLTHPVDASTTNLEFRGYEISLGYQSADKANTNRLSTSDVAARLESLKSVPGVGPESSTYLELRPDGLDARSTSPAVRAVTASSQINLAVGNLSVPGSPGLPVGSRAGALLGWTDGGAYARYRTNNAGGHWVETRNGAATETTSVGTTGDGKLTIQATNGVDIVGALTNNGAPISGGGGGSYPTDNITLTNTLQAATVKATGQVQGNTAAFTTQVETFNLFASNTTQVKDLIITGNINNVKYPFPLVVTTLITTDQAATAGDDTAIIWNSRDCDTTMNPTANPTRLVAPVAGMYFLTGNVSFSNQGGGMRGVWFRKNGTVRLRGQSNPPPSATQFAEIDAHAYARLAAGDYIEVMATVSGAAGAVTIKADNGTVGAMEWRRT